MNMSCPNKINDNVLSKMQIDYLECTRQVKHLKKLYSQELCINRKLKKSLLESQSKIQEISNTCIELKRKLQNYRVKDPGPPEKRRRKDWDQIKSDKTKQRRFNLYKDSIFSTLKELNVCHRAQITMWLPGNHITFSWGPEDFNDEVEINLNDGRTQQLLEDILNNHSYVKKTSLDNDDCSFNDTNFSEIYDNDGTLNKSHVQKIVHVMDCFRISHEAYHEIRTVSKGHLPLICKVCSEKKLMSEQLPYIKHPRVRELINFQGLRNSKLFSDVITNFFEQEDAIGRPISSVIEYLDPPVLTSVCLNISTQCI